MVEDLGPAAPRYQLALLLNVQERTLPTECVHYSLPYNLWTPVKMDDGDGGFGSLKVDALGRYKLVKDGLESDVTAPPTPPPAAAAAAAAAAALQQQQGSDCEQSQGSSAICYCYYLSGRITVKARPLGVFDRPGVLVSTHFANARGGNNNSVIIIMGVIQVQQLSIQNISHVQKKIYIYVK